MNALIDVLWRSAIAVVPLAVAVAIAGRVLPCRPSTRHILWLSVLAMLLVAPILPSAPIDVLRGAADNDNAEVAVASSPEQHASLGARPESPARRVSDMSYPRRPTTAPPSTTSLSREVHNTSAAPAREARDSSAAPAPEHTVAGPPPSVIAPAPAPHLPPSAPELAPVERPAPSIARAQRDSPLPASAITTARPTPTATASPASDAPSALSLWADRLRAARDLVVSLPPIPPGLWWSGAALVAVVAIARAARFRRLLRTATPAPPAIAREVLLAARTLGIARPPQALLTAANISPMLWCGRRVRLLLPRALWAQLDASARQAVLCHELAHLRRRDHWICWLTLVAGCVYWWHPIVWWMKRELGREADLSCDAWVVALLPSARRAYATALLETKRFTSIAAPPASVGLGASTLRARRFARRLAMVMSHHRRPEITPIGASLAALVAVAAWLATPILACPPESSTAPVAPRTPMASGVIVESAAPRAPRAPHAPHAPTAPAAPDETTFEAYMRDRAVDGSFEARLEAIEHKLAELALHLSGDPAPKARRAPGVPGGGVDAAPRESRTWSVGSAQAGPVVARTFKNELARTDCEPVTCPYTFSPGKLDALIALMSRSDVPILVSPGNGSIEVHATPEQHRIFQAFRAMINDDGESRHEYRFPPDKAEAIEALMSRSDVPILIEAPGDGVIVVHGSELEQHVFCAFISMIEPRHTAKAGVEAALRAEREAYAKHVGAAPLAALASEQLAHEYELQAGAAAQHAQLESLRAVLASHEAHRRESEKRCREIERRAAELEDEADRYAAQAEELEAQAEALEGGARLETLARANELLVKAKGMADEAQQLEAEAARAEAHAEGMEDEAESIEVQIEQVEEMLEDSRGAR